MKLIVLHFHFRPGGVRRVIESALPFIVKEMPGIDRVILASGEARDLEWNRALEKSLAPVATEFFTDPSFRYVSEQSAPAKIAPQIRAALTRLLTENDTLIWAHNLAIARHLPLARELTRASESRGLRLIAHHHDWWFDNRWLRWPEMQRTGFRTLKQIAHALFPNSPHTRFAAINRADTAMLRKQFAPRVGWLPNPATRPKLPSQKSIRAARDWMHAQLGHDAPIWLMPCRILRRKNIAEALLLTRWLQPEATLVITGSASSADEKPYANRLAATAAKQGWRLHIGLLDDAGPDAPPLPHLLAASECVLLTSIQEGFGLASLEAAAANRPLITRHLPNIAPDLHRFGFRFPHSYREILIAPDAFDWPAEQVRQRTMFSQWKDTLPRSCRIWAGRPHLLQSAAPELIPFSRLSLTAQLEVLILPAQESWQKCGRWNPLLRAWKSRAATGNLEINRWPATAEASLGGHAYARRFAQLAKAKPRTIAPPDNTLTAQQTFIRLKLQSAQLFPLLFARDS